MKDLINMETNPINFDKQLEEGLLRISRSVEEDDHKYGIDGWFDDDIPIAIRRRPTTSIDDYNGRVITIRIGKTIQYKFEYDKLLDGSFRAVLYLFKYQNTHLITIPTTSIVKYLKDTPLDQLDIAPNRYGGADLICIHPNELEKCLIIDICPMVINYDF